MKVFKGKSIYNPSGKAGEYSYWACNFYVGCSNGCKYCYLKKGRGASLLGSDTPSLKKCFKDENHAIEIFKKELLKNLIEIKKHGLFFSFTTDPMIKETIGLTCEAVRICQQHDIPVKILTKSIEMTTNLKHRIDFMPKRELIAIGFSLTGHDELEPNVDQNHARIRTIKRLKELGFKTFASIEPIISFNMSKQMILKTLDFCDLYKVGLESGAKYNKKDCIEFVKWLNTINKPYYMKESLRKLSGFKFGVERDYNIFNKGNKK